MFELSAGYPVPPQLQRNRDYMRQRQYSLSDLLLENRIIFFGSAGSTIFEPVITDLLVAMSIRLYCASMP